MTEHRRVPDDRPGVIEDFFDSIFGNAEPRTQVPLPPPPPPRYLPQSNQPPEDQDGSVEANADAAPAIAATRAPRRPPPRDPEDPVDEPDVDSDTPPPY